MDTDPRITEAAARHMPSGIPGRPGGLITAERRWRPDPGRARGAVATGPLPRGTQVEIVVPVHNEEATLESSIRRLHDHLETSFPWPSAITIADNASTDGTWDLACRLVGEVDGIRAVHLDEKGRGRALRTVWGESPAPVVAYMDVDLSTDLDGLLPLVAPLLSGHSDVAIGSRLAAGSRVLRGPKREVISRAYNLLLKVTLHNGFSDAQCGFKALRTRVARELLPLVEDQGWFFDTELLVLAERNGYRIHEVAVDWIDDPDSRVHIASTALEDLRGVARLAASLARGGGRVEGPYRTAPGDPFAGQVKRFASVGLASTLLYLAIFLLLRSHTGAFGANLLALGATGVLNLLGHRRVTFGVAGRAGVVREQAQGLVLLGIAMFTTTAALLLVGLVTAGLLAQLVALLAGGLLATMARFVLLRAWVFHRYRARPGPGAAPATHPSTGTDHKDALR